jgi:maltose O-acetyltransferase
MMIHVDLHLNTDQKNHGYLHADRSVNLLMKLIRYFAYFMYMILFRYTPEHYRPYALFFPWIRNKLASVFLKRCGKNIRIHHNADISANIEVGDHCIIGTRCMIQSGVVMGDYIMIGPDVKIYSRNHVFSSLETPVSLQGKEFKKTILGNDVWIGANCVILPGVKIGHKTVIAAGSIVTKDIPDFALVGGNPARVIRMRNENTGGD